MTPAIPQIKRKIFAFKVSPSYDKQYPKFLNKSLSEGDLPGKVVVIFIICWPLFWNPLKMLACHTPGILKYFL
jgi:hypothetical protein